MIISSRFLRRCVSKIPFHCCGRVPLLFSSDRTFHRYESYRICLSFKYPTSQWRFNVQTFNTDSDRCQSSLRVKRATSMYMHVHTHASSLILGDSELNKISSINEACWTWLNVGLVSTVTYLMQDIYFTRSSQDILARLISQGKKRKNHENW